MGERGCVCESSVVFFLVSTLMLLLNGSLGGRIKRCRWWHAAIVMSRDDTPAVEIDARLRCKAQHIIQRPRSVRSGIRHAVRRQMALIRHRPKLIIVDSTQIRLRNRSRELIRHTRRRRQRSEWRAPAEERRVRRRRLKPRNQIRRLRRQARGDCCCCCCRAVREGRRIVWAEECRLIVVEGWPVLVKAALLLGLDAVRARKDWKWVPRSAGLTGWDIEVAYLWRSTPACSRSTRRTPSSSGDTDRTSGSAV